MHEKRVARANRRELFGSVAVMAAAITGALTFTYGFLETAGYLRLSMFIVWAVLGTSWAVVACLRKLLA